MLPKVREDVLGVIIVDPDPAFLDVRFLCFVYEGVQKG
jgi:hypothetical protein